MYYGCTRVIVGPISIIALAFRNNNSSRYKASAHRASMATRSRTEIVCRISVELQLKIVSKNKGLILVQPESGSMHDFADSITIQHNWRADWE